jgi:hypothetical protein
VLDKVPELVSEVNEPAPAVRGIVEARIDPPVMVRPLAEESPPLEATEIPPAKVEVAVEEALIAWSLVRPEILIPEAKVEEAVAKSPPALVRVNIVVEAMFWTIKGSPL